MAIKTASAAAVGKVFNAVLSANAAGTKGSSASSDKNGGPKNRYSKSTADAGDDNDDLFDPKEKLLLGMKL